ncbi:MAG: SatD family protein [Candidatus Desulfofervidaceae bacterium]|nr:SatD family protein [Candidatus Desulfofervidaceae bacterium]
MRKKLFVLLGDVVHSRYITDREKFQEKLIMACKRVNATYSSDIYADFKILKGIDEVGGILSVISNSYRIIRTISEEIHPNLIRFVLVWDYVDLISDTTDISKMDGIAFHKASEMLNKLKETKFLFDMCVTDEIIDMAITGQVNLISFIKRNWSPRQYQVIKAYEKIKNQQKVAERLGITQQAVSKILGYSGWKEISTVEESLNYILHAYAQRIGT